MALEYRSLWCDSIEQPLRFAQTHWSNWVKSRGFQFAVEVPEEIVQSRHGRTGRLIHRNTESDGQTIYEWELQEEQSLTKSVTLTRLIMVVADEEPTHFAVEVERQGARQSHIQEFKAPSIVKAFLESGNQILVDGHPFTAVPAKLQNGDLLHLLKSDTREFPLLIFSDDPWTKSIDIPESENIASDRFSGVVQVVHASAEQTKAIRESNVSDDPFLAGDVLLALPQRSNWRREATIRILSRSQIENRFTPSDHFLSMIASAATSRRLSDKILSGLKLLRSQSHEGSPELLKLAEELITDQEISISDLRDRVALLEQDLFDAQVELESEVSEFNFRREQFALLISNQRGESSDELSHIPEFRTSVQAIHKARELLTGVVIPTGVERDLNDVDSHPLRKVWANSMWQGLRALHEYAYSSFDGDFRQWCLDGASAYAWSSSPKKLAMRESESTESNQKLRDQRLFPVIAELDITGKKLMVAHLKIASTGSVLIPRVYFFDDTRGPTRKVHVGFIGPHKSIDNTSTN